MSTLTSPATVIYLCQRHLTLEPVVLLRDDFDLSYSLHLINMGVSPFIYPKDLSVVGFSRHHCYFHVCSSSDIWDMSLWFPSTSLYTCDGKHGHIYKCLFLLCVGNHPNKLHMYHFSMKLSSTISSCNFPASNHHIWFFWEILHQYHSHPSLSSKDNSRMQNRPQE